MIDNAQYIDTSGSTLAGTVVAQGLEKLEKSCVPTDMFKQEFPSLWSSKSHSFTKLVSGEKVTSVFDLVHRFIKNPVDVTVIADTPKRFRQIVTPDPGNGLPYFLPFEVFRYWSWFSRGGTVMKFVPMGTTRCSGTLYATNIYNDVNDNYYNHLGPSGTAGEHLGFKPSLEISVPFYFKYPFSTKEYTHPTPYRVANQPDTFNGVSLEFMGDGTTGNRSFYQFIAAKDDYSYGYFRGCPRVLVNVNQG